LLRRVFTITLLIVWLVAAVTAQAAGPVRLFIFYTDTCGHCQVVLNEVLPPLQARYGSNLEVRGFEISTAANYEVMLKLEKLYGVSAPDFPEIFIGQEVLVGEAAIRTRLPALIDKYLAQGGVDFPSNDQPVAPSAPTSASSAQTVYLAYFYKTGCQTCDRTSYDLNYLKGKHPELLVKEFDIATADNKALNEVLSKKYGVPEEKHLVTPMIFVGSDYLVGEAANAANLQALVEKYRGQGTTPPWEGVDIEQGRNVILERFRHLSPLAVLGAGLIEGLNPCGFATIIFLISYLAFAGLKNRQILAVGLAFTFGVFAAHLLIGAGLLAFLQTVSFISVLAKVLYAIIAVMCLLLAAISLADYVKVRQGRAEEMTLQLPKFLKKQVHRMIRQTSKWQTTVLYALAALGIGAVVAALEVVCTGQVYLPTILFVAQMPELRANALFYLTLYNLMFVLPLVIVFLLAFYGTTTRQLGDFLDRHMGAVKLTTAIFFLVLGGWLVYSLL
jgi:cytochrome c biogenesis protein CcdA/thiol-disulfide isomerase/thioredoxin